MTATETFRAMLDERGVEWMGTDYTEPTSGHATNTSLGSEYHDAVFVEYVDGTALRLFDLTPEQAIAATLGVSDATQTRQGVASFNCTNSERTNAACKPITYDNGYSTDHLEPGEYHEFWEPACACGNCGELIPMRKFCPNCGCRLEVEA